MRTSKQVAETLIISLEGRERFSYKPPGVFKQAKDICQIVVDDFGFRLYHGTPESLKSIPLYFAHPNGVPGMPYAVATEVLRCTDELRGISAPADLAEE